MPPPRERPPDPVRVLAHFLPGESVLDAVAREADWLEVRWVPMKTTT